MSATEKWARLYIISPDLIRGEAEISVRYSAAFEIWCEKISPLTSFGRNDGKALCRRDIDAMNAPPPFSARSRS